MHDIHNRLFRFYRFIVRCFSPRYQTSRSHDMAEPAVYVVHHQNLQGPITIHAWFDTPVRTWVLSVFFDRISCFKQYYNYTFTKRFGMPRLLAAIIAYPLSLFISHLMHVIRAIPVFRGSRDIMATFKQSVSALLKGHNLLICPDIDYADSSSHIGEMYDGFLNLEKYYTKETGRHLPFIPLHISKNRGTIYQGEAVYFDDETSFKRAKSIVYQKLKQEFMRLEQEDMNIV